MRALLRAYDAIGRYGGEEFLMVLPGCTSQDAFKLADRLRVGMSQEPVKIPGGTLDVMCSLGVAASDTIAILDPTALIQAADSALYRAKAGGRNRVELATVNRHHTSHQLIACCSHNNPCSSGGRHGMARPGAHHPDQRG
jgi:diguanylate cyclase (GGDEF)-like protein